MREECISAHKKCTNKLKNILERVSWKVWRGEGVGLEIQI